MGDEREQVLDADCEAFNDVIFYDRKTDDTPSEVELLRRVREGIVTKEEIIARFARLIETWDVSR